MPHTCRQYIKTMSLSKVFRTRGSTLPRAIPRAHSVRTDKQRRPLTPEQPTVTRTIDIKLVASIQRYQ